METAHLIRNVSVVAVTTGQPKEGLQRVAEELFGQSRRHQYDTVLEPRDKAGASFPQTAAGVFATTHWSVVLAAGQDASVAATTALEQLCRTYWYPLYAYLRRRGYGEHDAQDLTQGFLAQLLERRSIQDVAPEKGKFRSFLLASLNYFLADEHDRAMAQKRGGGREVLSLEFQQAEGWYRSNRSINGIRKRSMSVAGP